MRTCVIFNPAARGDKARHFRDHLTALSAEVTLKPTYAAGAGRPLAAEAVREGFEVVVAAGGDGTVNEVTNGLAGSDTALGVLPMGTMNVFAKEHGVPGDLEGAWEVVRRGVVREIDLAAAGGHHFIQLAGVGLDAQAVKETKWETKKRLGPLSYLISAAQIAARTPPRLLVESEGSTREGSFVLIGNGRYYGAKMTLFPQAKSDDGLLDVLIFKNLGYLDIARYLGGVMLGKHTGLADVEYFQTAKVSIESPVAVPVEVDGELLGELPVTFRIAGKLRACVP